MSVHDEIFNN